MGIMGMRAAIEFNGQLHDYSHTYPAVQEFGKVSREKGLRAVLEWGDNKFGNDLRNLRKMAQEKGTGFRFPQVLSMPEVGEALQKCEAERKKEIEKKS
jgi:hypothetical protein